MDAAMKDVFRTASSAAWREWQHRVHEAHDLRLAGKDCTQANAAEQVAWEKWKNIRRSWANFDSMPLR